jgi:hypothetical protein
MMNQVHRPLRTSCIVFFVAILGLAWGCDSGGDDRGGGTQAKGAQVVPRMGPFVANLVAVGEGEILDQRRLHVTKCLAE